MSSHREAPEISKDPVADGTDVYAFVSPEDPSTVTLIANFIPLQKPDGGPNFYEFGDDVRYEIHVSNRGKAEPDVTYRFKFHTVVRNAKTFLYNTGPINDISDKTWNRPQFYSVTRIRDGKEKVLASGLRCPPVNVGKRSTPDYAKLSSQAVHSLTGKRKVFAGQRADAFHVDLGSVFDLGALRPFNEAHVISMPEMNGVNSVQSYNVHTIAIQVPIKEITRDRSRPTDPMAPKAVVGVWATASRRTSRIFDPQSVPTSGTAPGSRCRGSATRCSTRSSSRWPRRTGGTPARPRATRGTRGTSTSPSSPPCCRCSIPGSSRTSRRTRSRART